MIIGNGELTGYAVFLFLLAVLLFGFMYLVHAEADNAGGDQG